MGDPSNVNCLPLGVLHMIFSRLGPKDLCRVTATCTLWYTLHRDRAANRQWRAFYKLRWRAGLTGSETGLGLSWQGLYGKKMLDLRSYSGKYAQDNLNGHRLDVRAAKLLPYYDLLVTGSSDRTIRTWSLATGLQASSTRPFTSGAPRCLAVDPTLLAVGSTDHTIRIWHAARPAPAGPPAPLFDLAAPPATFSDHFGPVTSLSLIDTHLYSGSWDYSVRIWSRDTWACQGVLKYDDWVSCVAARGDHLLVSAGAEVLVHDLTTSQVVRKLQNLHEGGATCLEGGHSGRMLFTGAADGLVLAHDLRMKDPSLLLWHHNSAVNSLAFEDPWLATASSSGCVMLLNTEAPTPRTAPGGRASTKAQHQPPSARHMQAPSARVLSVDVADRWLACGCEGGAVRLWDFSGANEAAGRAAAARAARGSRKARRHTTPPPEARSPPQATNPLLASAPAASSTPVPRSTPRRNNAQQHRRGSGGGVGARTPPQSHPRLPPSSPSTSSLSPGGTPGSSPTSAGLHGPPPASPLSSPSSSPPTAPTPFHHTASPSLSSSPSTPTTPHARYNLPMLTATTPSPSSSTNPQPTAPNYPSHHTHPASPAPPTRSTGGPPPGRARGRRGGVPGPWQATAEASSARDGQPPPPPPEASSGTMQVFRKVQRRGSGAAAATAGGSGASASTGSGSGSGADPVGDGEGSSGGI